LTPDSDRIRNYTRSWRIWERVQLLATASGWPARLARALGSRTEVAVEELALHLDNRPGPPLRLAFASDFHAGPTTHPEVLANACAALRKAAPDVLLLGGDFVCLHARYVDALAEMLGTVPAPLGRYAVLGNHDLWVDHRHIERKLGAAGIELLTNRSVRLPPPYDGMWICGLDDHSSGQPDAAAALRGTGGIRIILMHAPSGLLDLAGERFEVAFCGHTHGGQIALPGGFPLVVPQGSLSRTYARGVFRLDAGRTLIVSRGIGCSTLPLRAYSAPHVIVCTLVSRLADLPDADC
jgi:predicted MPP superfamily phosphohydrolase